MSGFSAWIFQRLTAVYLAFFTIFALVVLIINDIDAMLWQEWFQTLWVQLALLLLVFSLLLHAWVGIRDVIIDYIHPLGLRLLLLSLAGLFLVTNGFWLLIILWGST